MAEGRQGQGKARNGSKDIPVGEMDADSPLGVWGPTGKQDLWDNRLNVRSKKVKGEK